VRSTHWHRPWWLPGGNAQTIWAAKCAWAPNEPDIGWQRQRWTTPDGDFIDVDRSLAPAPSNPAARGLNPAPQLVLLHGLEGSSSSPYARAFAWAARQRGWDCAVPHFRGCSGSINLAPRAYHSGDHQEVDWILKRFRAEHPGRPILAVGISLGGNALMRWAQEHGHAARQTAQAIAAVSSPLDLTQSGAALDRGFNRWVYARMFLQTMRRKAETKWQQFPGLFDIERVRRARTLYEFDDVFTAPLHGFTGTADYWHRAAAKTRMADVRMPALALNARNDPFVPAHSLPQPDAVGPWVTLWQPDQGGHVGFCDSTPPRRFPGHVLGMPGHVLDWLQSATGAAHG